MGHRLIALVAQLTTHYARVYRLWSLVARGCIQVDPTGHSPGCTTLTLRRLRIVPKAVAPGLHTYKALPADALHPAHSLLFFAGLNLQVLFAMNQDLTATPKTAAQVRKAPDLRAAGVRCGGPWRIHFLSIVFCTRHLACFRTLSAEWCACHHGSRPRFNLRDQFKI